MRAHYPSNKTNHLKVAQQYFRECRKALVRGILLASEDQLSGELVPISWRDLRFACGQYGSKTNRQYWFDWLHANHPIIEKVKDGYSFGKKGSLTTVKIMRNIELILACKDPAETFQAFYENEVDSDIDWVNIDLASLSAFIKSNQAIANRNTKLDYNLRQAQIILDIATYCNGQLPQIVNESHFGRKYYRGPNLQNTSKIVRHAALGDCHQYDIEASVFVWKLDLSKDIDSTIKLPATLDYLDHKAYHRKRLAELVFGNKYDYTVNTIKQAITAIGFGARATNAIWIEDGQKKTTSLREIITSEEYLKKFLDDSLISEFMTEQETMNRLIFDQVKEDPRYKNNTNLHTDSGRLSRNKTISFLYQNTERAVVRQLLAIAKPADILLECHDGFYTKHRADLAGMRYELKQFLSNGRLDHEEHHAYKFTDYKQEEQEHKKFIWSQEQQLREQYGSLTKDSYNPIIRKTVAQRNEDYDSGHWDEDMAYDYYDPENDPFLDELDPSERNAFLNQRDYALQQLEFENLFKGTKYGNR